MTRASLLRSSLLAVMALFAIGGPAPAQRGGEFPYAEAARKGFESRQGRSPQWIYAQHKKLTATLAALPAQRPGVVDAYVVAIGLDADPVFGREAAEAAKVLARRYDTGGRMVLLSAGGGAGAVAVANGSPGNLTLTLGAIAEKMDPREDVLILFTTSHGAPEYGLAFNDGENGYGMITPQRLKEMIDGFGIKRRMLLISACYSGIFVPMFNDADSVVVTAASSTTTSFGCAATNDWTYFGDALINNELRTPVAFDSAVGEAFGLINSWELMKGAPPSMPQYHRGANANAWLDALEARVPKAASPKVGRPSISGG